MTFGVIVINHYQWHHSSSLLNWPQPKEEQHDEIEVSAWRSYILNGDQVVYGTFFTFYSSPRPLPTQPTLPLSVYLPAVTHVLTFQNAWKVTSRRCVTGRVDSAKKQHVYHQDSIPRFSVKLSRPLSNTESPSLFYLRCLDAKLPKRSPFSSMPRFRDW